MKKKTTFCLTNKNLIMKIKHYFMAAFMLCMGMVACETLSEEPTLPEDAPKTFTARFNMTGEINVSQTPLTRFTPDSNDLYAIQVKYRPVSGGSYANYAYGLFDDLSNVTLELVENHYYDFEVIMIDDAKEKIYCDSILVDSKMYHGYGKPFDAYNYYNASASRSITKVSNEFEYSEKKHFDWSGTTDLMIQITDGKSVYSAANVDAYYAEVDKYVPEADNEEISIYLKKMVYGIRVVACDFLTEGTLKVSIDSQHVQKLSPDSKIYESSFGYLGSASSWYGAVSSDAAKTSVSLDFTWTKDDGTVYNYKATSITCNRLTMTTVNVDFYDDGKVENNKLVMKYEDTEMGEGKTYTHGDEQEDYDW